MSRWRAVLRGAASLLDFQGALIPKPLSDQEAMAQAWNEVGGLIGDALPQPANCKEHDATKSGTDT